MFLHDLCGSWLEHPFWRTSFLIEDARDVQRLLEHGIDEVWIDTSRGIDVHHEPVALVRHETIDPVHVAQSPVGLPDARCLLADELARADAICRRGKAAVAELFKAARLGRAILADPINPVVDDIVGSVLRHPGALISLSCLKTTDHDTFVHSVAVSALLVALGRQLDLDAATLHDVGLGGLVHDIGKTVVPLAVLSKKGPLTDNEFLAMKSHPIDGQRILQKGVGFGPIAMEICLHHHEKLDGTGYPNRLKGDAISLFSRMSAVCDVYEAITADRCYRAGWNPGEAVRKMISWCPDHLDRQIFHAFVKVIGIYPIGSLVRLRSAHLAVVIEQAEASVVTPIVKVFFSVAKKSRIPAYLLELATADDGIVGLEDPRDWRLSEADAIWHLVQGKT